VTAVRARVPLSWARRGALPGSGPVIGSPGGKPGPGTIAPLPGAPPPPPPPPPPPDNPRFIQVTADDSDPDAWFLLPSRTTLAAGAVEVEFNNRYAQDPHDLHLKRVGGGGGPFAFPQIDNGETATQTVALSAGTWKLWCNIAGHEQQGMVTQVTVS
jgi:hypothetical protein